MCKQIHSIVRIVCFALHFFLLTPPGHAQTTESFAILDFEAKGVSEVEVGVLADRLEAGLVSLNTAIVVERGKMRQILEEQDFQISGCTSNECAVEVGQLLGVTLMVTGSIGKIGSTYSINLRTIKVATGEIIQSIMRDYRGEIDGLLGEMLAIANELAGASGSGVRATPIPIKVEVGDTKQEDLKPLFEYNIPYQGNIGDSVLVYVRENWRTGRIGYLPSAKRSRRAAFRQQDDYYIAKGIVIGRGVSEEFVQVELNNSKSVKTPSKDIIKYNSGGFTIGGNFTVGDTVAFYNDEDDVGFQMGRVLEIVRNDIKIEMTFSFSGIQEDKLLTIARNLVIYSPRWTVP